MEWIAPIQAFFMIARCIHTLKESIKSNVKYYDKAKTNNARDF